MKFNENHLKEIDKKIDLFFKENKYIFNEHKWILLIKSINKILKNSYSIEEFEVLQSHILVDLVEVTFNHYNLNKNQLINILLSKFDIEYNKLLGNCLF